MKKILLCFAMIIGCLITNAQFFCYDTIEYEDRTNDYCIRAKPNNNTDTALFISRYIPNEATPIVTIPVNVHVWRKDDGTGNWWQDTPAFRDSLQLAFDYLNLIYSHNDTFSLYIPNTQFIEDTKVRFEIDTVYYYNNSQLAYDTTTGPFISYLASNFPERLNNFSYHLSIDSLAARSGCSNGYNNPYPTIVSVHQNKPKHLYGFALHMAHEFGHAFGLCHTYLNDPLEVNLIGSKEFLWDVFGTVQQPWCHHMSPGRVCMHDAGWDCDPYDSTNTCTNNIMGGTSYSRHFSALQCGRIWRALQVSNLRKYAYGEENPPDLHITENQLVDYTRKYYQTVVVDSGVTLTITCRVEMAPSAKLIVRPGGKLIVDGGTLTSACPGELWQGIEVVGDRTKRQIAQYQGTVELRNGAVIENALCGIRTGLREDTEYFTTGGIIKADSAHFVNNCKAVAFYPYTNILPNGNAASNVSHFRNCEFRVDNGNHFVSNGFDPNDHVTLWDVWDIKFKGCTFTNQTGARYQRRHAIYAEDAGFTLDTYCNSEQAVPAGCDCPAANSTYNTFSGFYTAVEALTTGAQHAVQINHALFSNNHTGVKIAGNHFTSVTRCEFDLDQVPIQSLSNRGLDLRTSTGYLVEGNTFSRSTYSDPLLFASAGICVDSSGTGDNTLHLNTFEKLGYGIYVARNNGNARSGLQTTCNDFYHNKYDIYMSNGSSMRNNQGEIGSGADNNFRNTQTNSFRYVGSPSITYYYSSGGYHTPYNLNNSYVNENSSAAANSCAPTLCNGGGVPPKLAEFQSDMDACTGSTQPLSDIYYTAVRTLMSDTVLDLTELEQWHAAAQHIGDPYSLTETRFMEGYVETFTADVDDAEMANYAEFHALKLALRGDNNDNADNQDNTGNDNSPNSLNSPTINWYSLTNSQIAQLQTIAERNTGRASVMAKGVLCFFHGICYEDDLLGDDNMDNQNNNMETRSAKVPQQEGETNLTVYPNPTDDVLFIELRGGTGIANVALYDLQGRVVETCHGASLRGGTATITVKSIPAGVYVLRVTDADGKDYHQKIVRK